MFDTVNCKGLLMWGIGAALNISGDNIYKYFHRAWEKRFDAAICHARRLQGNMGHWDNCDPFTEACVALSSCEVRALSCYIAEGMPCKNRRQCT